MRRIEGLVASRGDRSDGNRVLLPSWFPYSFHLRDSASLWFIILSKSSVVKRGIHKCLGWGKIAIDAQFAPFPRLTVHSTNAFRQAQQGNAACAAHRATPALYRGPQPGFKGCFWPLDRADHDRARGQKHGLTGEIINRSARAGWSTDCANHPVRTIVQTRAISFSSSM